MSFLLQTIEGTGYLLVPAGIQNKETELLFTLCIFKSINLQQTSNSGLLFLISVLSLSLSLQFVACNLSCFGKL